MGRLVGMKFDRAEFAEALFDALLARFGADNAEAEDAEAILADLEDSVEGFDDIFEEDEDEEDDEEE